METDASDYATGAVLSQLCEDEKWRPVGFMSKSLNDTERNYPIYDKEMLSVIRALQEWRHLLEGATHPVDIYNDHQNLIYFTQAQNLNRRQARWSLYLSRFSVALHHRPGRSSGKPDALSRRSDHKTEGPDNANQVLLTPEYFEVKASGGIVLDHEGEGFIDRIRKCRVLDEAVVKAFKELEGTAGTFRGAEWKNEGGLVTFNGMIYVPKDNQLRYDIVHAHHDTPVAGHPGRWKTQELVTRNYWWPGIAHYIAQYVKSCDACNRTKIYPSAPAGQLIPNEIPQRKWQVVTTDLIVGLPESHGSNAIWVAVDRLSKRIHIAPTTKEVTSLGVARLFRDHVWRHHGLPDQIISDRGSQFVSSFTRELNHMLGIRTSLSTAFHPETDGQTERVNQEIEQYLRVFVNQRQDDWSEWLPLVEFAYNNRIHSSTRQTPFVLDTGQHPRMGVEPNRYSKVEAVDQFTSRIKSMTEEAQSALKQAASDMARFYNAKRSEHPKFKVGEKVWLDGENISTTRPMKKLDNRWYGPFTVEAIVSDNAYRLAMTPPFKRVHPVFHVSLLRRYTPDTIKERPQPTNPEPEINEKGETVYEVEKILDSRYRWGRLEYLVKWKGFGPEWDTWEAENNVEGAKRLVKQFHKTNPSAPQRISAATWQSIPFKRYGTVTGAPRCLYKWEDGSTRRVAES